MGVARWQTVEDGAPREAPHVTLHDEALATEFLRVEMSVRVEWWRLGSPPRAQLVIRASQVTGEVTAALERIRIE